MRIYFDDIKQMVTESVNRILSEGISDITYHFASFKSCINILKNNAFHLTLSSNKSDAYDNKRLFYLSTQRSRNKDIGYSGHLGSCIRIQLDGNALMTKYTGKPIDYWGDSMGKQSYYRDDHDSIYGKGFTQSRQTHHNFEMEDRVFSYDPVISNASEYITRIDVFIDPETERLNYLANAKNVKEDTKESINNEIQNRINSEKEEAITIWTLSKRNNIPVYIYNNLKDFNFMTNNTINNEISQLYKDGYYYNTEKNYTDCGLYKISKDINKNDKYIYILTQLFNVLTEGGIWRDENRFKIISTTLKNFGLEKYTRDVINKVNHSWGNSFEESCELLSGTINAPIRKLNSEEYPEDDDANRIMRFGAYVLKHLGVSNFNSLRWKRQ